MNLLSTVTLKILKKIYSKVFVSSPHFNVLDTINDADVTSQLIYDILESDQPSMIARFGSTELATMINYIGVKKKERNILTYIQGKSPAWWWNKSMIEQMQRWSGFFPPTIEYVEKFCELMLNDIKEVDILGSWLADEMYFENEMYCTKVHLRFLEPFWASEPWTKVLKGKRILVVHPFAETIMQQYEKREDLFKVMDTLPEFASLTVIKAVQTLGQASNEFSDWFEALDSMKQQINKTDFDVCLIGAGAYGFPLAAHVKRIGKKAVHLGGSLQLLFGIKGKRWEDPNCGVQVGGIPYGFYPSLMNKYWTRPLNDEKPQNANEVEGACYW